MDTLSRLCAWYESQCIGEWQEGYGVNIDTLDNPGWMVKIHLEGTAAEGVDFQKIEFDRSDDDWAMMRKNGEVFEAAGDPGKLGEIIETFLNWVEAMPWSLTRPIKHTLTERQKSILRKAFKDQNPEKWIDSIEREMLRFDQIDKLINTLNDEFYIDGLSKDFTDTDYRQEIDALIDIANLPRVRVNPKTYTIYSRN